MRKPICLLCFILISAQITFAQLQLTNNKLQIADIDSGTLKLRSKLYEKIPAGDLNIYGFNLNEVPIYNDEAYAKRLSLIESEIPLPYNSNVKAFIDLYTIRKRPLLSKILGLSKHYFPQIEEIFDRENIPIEMKYLAVIESSLNQHATSPVGAGGMWQFMAPTGRIYGLTTSSHLDERRDFIKSTEAAVKYFKDSYRIYNDWLLVIASYNCGAGNVNKAIRKSGGKRNFWAIMSYLPSETRGYVPAFIAAAYAMNYAAEHNIYPSDSLNLYHHLDTVMVDNRFSIDQIALALNMQTEEIKNLNPSLKKGYIPFVSNKISLTLPYSKAVQFIELQNSENAMIADENLMSLNIKTVEKSVRFSYKVRKGDQLASLAKKYDVGVRDLKRWNKIRNGKIRKGQRLTIYSNKA